MNIHLKILLKNGDYITGVKEISINQGTLFYGGWPADSLWVSALEVRQVTMDLEYEGPGVPLRFKADPRPFSESSPTWGKHQHDAPICDETEQIHGFDS